MAAKSYSIVEYYSEQKNYKCGYCKGPNSSFSHGMWSHKLTVQDYQNLIDRGWRRSGSYCYKPMMDQTCCPAYTIRCEALDFKISKSQKKILKRMANFLKNKLNKDEGMATSDIDVDHHDKLDISITDIPNYEILATKAGANALKINVTSVSSEVNERLQGAENSQSFSESRSKASFPTQLAETDSKSKILPFKDTVLNKKQMSSVDPNERPLKKAKLMRLERKQNKLLSQGKSVTEIEAMMKERKQPQSGNKTLEELFSEINSESNKLEMRLVRTAPMNSEYISTANESFEVYKKYQTKIHGERKVTMKQFTRFLVKSPLQEWCPEDGPPQGYGSFHEQYWLNGQLIAVGVIDILPSCVSSVYFFYDPTYSHLSLGTFSSLREVFLTRQLNRTAPNLKYYYMGFYIHICPKMRYKARMTPSKLLCPETYAFCDIDKCLPKLDAHKYSRLNDDIDAIDEDGVVNTEEVLVLYRERAMTYGTYKRRMWLVNDEDEIREYATLVGMKCAKSILLYRSCAV
ncbi:arginyl-tRNA--protein transferase 1 [Belonocnema kinseyi]|uniref:arginyl-tRNA--protein transferase 1 n=1 Tax=Belonocnema kinseyi TaxID=2817044 RepID=UPI00143DFCF1|nr:arginyl-tRNA--protein transferase 1 [Belonocnema kinseyi]XP_033218994.1 arginyl-tRNA--protein transferase 1 [Belonocnema kinseyi]XP_033218996.1 arginyl-tRNA--protein transferase 1 [Belonocnema kinseyi]